MEHTSHIKDKPAMSLYLIAFLFPDYVTEKVRAVQREVKRDYGPKRSLHKPVHITLVPPFSAEKSFEQQNQLHHLAEQYPPFQLRLKNYGCFNRRRNHVLFINIDNDEVLQPIYHGIRELWEPPIYPPMQWRDEYHPHVTVAYKDVMPWIFQKLWPAFEHRGFESSFRQNGFTLMRYDNHVWVPIQEFKFVGVLEGIP